jgi:alpha-1,3-fucosyltransferase 10
VQRGLDIDGGTGSEDKPLILFCNSFFDKPVDTSALSCTGAVEFTNDRGRLSRAAAVVFHVPTIHEVGTIRKYPGQVWVAWSLESVANYPELARPEFLRFFDLRMTYEQSADVWDPYLPFEDEFERALALPIPPKTAAAPAVMFQSVDLDRSGRNEFAAELMSLMPVDSYGRFLNNRQLEIPDRGRETKLEVFGSYKFCIGFENSICTDYVTEKFFDPFLSGSVPVYRGASNVDDFAPGPHSYINAADFSGPRELAEYLTYLDGNDAAYGEYFAWRQNGLAPRLKELLERRGSEPFCKLASLVVERGGAPARPSWLTRMQSPRVRFRTDRPS